jgi:hypothetical protein
MDKYGQLLGKIYPLLDPEISDPVKRIKKHKNWYKDSAGNHTFLTQ